LANGELCVALGYSGDVAQARDRAREANSGIEIKYVIPKEGSIIWFMLLAIPDHAPNVDGAHQFINYIMTPNVIADISNFSHVPNGNVAALPLLTPAVRDDPSTYPAPDVRERLLVPLPDSPEQLRAISRMWQKFKAGG
jgi:putrescine transport system substrate-binding protein